VPIVGYIAVHAFGCVPVKRIKSGDDVAPPSTVGLILEHAKQSNTNPMLIFPEVQMCSKNVCDVNQNRFYNWDS
jgi:hypothetical protein